MKPLVSVISSVCNAPIEYIQLAVESVLCQTYEHFEYIIVIDNPSRTDVMEWIESLQEDRLHLVINDKNIGLQKSLNVGLSYCKGKYIARMDDDDICFPERFEREIALIEQDGCDLVGTNYYQIDESGHTIGRSDMPRDHDSLQAIIKLGGGILHPSWMGKHMLFTSLNGYREIALAEDYDFLIRALLEGCRFGVVTEPLMYYRKNLKGVSQQNKGRQKVVAEILRNQIRDGKVHSIEQIQDTVLQSERRINQYTQYYTFTRAVHDAIHERKRIGWQEMQMIRPYFTKIFLHDVMKNMRVKKIQKTNKHDSYRR